MSVESGGIGGVGAAVSVGPSLNARFGPSISGPESISRLSSSIVNEGPAGRFGLEKTMSIATLKPTGEIKFNNSIAGNVSVEPVKNKPLPDPAVIGEAAYWFVDREPKIIKSAQVLRSRVEPVTSLSSPAVLPAVVLSLESKTKTNLEEIIEEQVIQDAQLLEDMEIDKKLYLEDEEVSAQRKDEIRQAIFKAKLEALTLGLKKITGKLIAMFLPAEHAGNRSQIVKKRGPDGSYEETLEAIASSGEFDSALEAAKRAEKIVEEKKPVKKGKEGKKVASFDVARVFKFRRENMIIDISHIWG